MQFQMGGRGKEEEETATSGGNHLERMGGKDSRRRLTHIEGESTDFNLISKVMT